MNNKSFFSTILHNHNIFLSTAEFLTHKCSFIRFIEILPLYVDKNNYKRFFRTKQVYLLTRFFLLLLFYIQEDDIPTKHKVTLLVITYIGCALSLAGEVLTVVVYVVFM